MIIGICVTALEHRSDACSGAGHSEATKKLPGATRHEVPFAKNRTRLLRLARLSDTRRSVTSLVRYGGWFADGGFLAEEAEPIGGAAGPDGGDVDLGGEIVAVGIAFFGQFVGDQAGVGRDGDEMNVVHRVVGNREANDVLEDLGFGGGAVVIDEDGFVGGEIAEAGNVALFESVETGALRGNDLFLERSVAWRCDARAKWFCDGCSNRGPAQQKRDESNERYEGESDRSFLHHVPLQSVSLEVFLSRIFALACLTLDS